MKDKGGVWEMVDDIAEDEGLRSVYVDLAADGGRPHWLISLINYLQPFFVFVVLLSVGVGVFTEMAIQFEQHADEIEEIGPPGVTNVGLIAGVTLGCALGGHVLVWYYNRKEQKNSE